MFHFFSEIKAKREKRIKKDRKLQNNERKVSIKLDEINNANEAPKTEESTLPTHIIIDCSMFSYIDTSGVTALKETVKRHENIGIITLLSGKY